MSPRDIRCQRSVAGCQAEADSRFDCGEPTVKTDARWLQVHIVWLDGCIGVHGT